MKNGWIPSSQPWLCQPMIKDVIVYIFRRWIQPIMENGGFQRVSGKMTGKGTMKATKEQGE